NYIGTNLQGDGALPTTGTPQQNGVVIDGAYLNSVGSSYLGRPFDNLISGNAKDGVLILNGANVNLVFNDWIGTNATGDGIVRNGANGVEVVNSDGNAIGSHREHGQGNNIAGNSNGVFLNGANNTHVYGNSIATLNLTNAGRGIVVQDSLNTFIGDSGD